MLTATLRPRHYGRIIASPYAPVNVSSSISVNFFAFSWLMADVFPLTCDRYVGGEVPLKLGVSS